MICRGVPPLTLAHSWGVAVLAWSYCVQANACGGAGTGVLVLEPDDPEPDDPEPDDPEPDDPGVEVLLPLDEPIVLLVPLPEVLLHPAKRSSMSSIGSSNSNQGLECQRIMYRMIPPSLVGTPSNQVTVTRIAY